MTETSDSSTNCERCGTQSTDLREFKMFREMQPYVADHVDPETGRKSHDRILAPVYAPPVMLCYPCYRQGVQIDKRKL